MLKPFAADWYPKLFTSPETQVYTVEPERTFWEKVTILHREALRTPERGPMQPRYSRHYYDLWCMARSSVRTSAFDDMALVVGTSRVGYDADNGSNLMNVTLYYNKLYAAI